MCFCFPLGYSEIVLLHMSDAPKRKISSISRNAGLRRSLSILVECGPNRYEPSTTCRQLTLQPIAFNALHCSEQESIQVRSKAKSGTSEKSVLYD